jgi:hypothetical protein
VEVDGTRRVALAKLERAIVSGKGDTVRWSLASAAARRA